MGVASQCVLPLPAVASPLALIMLPHGHVPLARPPGPVLGRRHARFDPVMVRPNIPTSKRVSYALGYLGLGLIEQASEELEAVEGDDRLSIPVMLARIELYMAAKNWDLLIAVAKGVARADPSHEQAWIGWAYALRCLERTAEARAVLLEAEPHHGKQSALLHYNLACYECLLGDMAKAKTRLRRACKMGGTEFKTLALDDPDLQAMWEEIGRMG